MTDQTPRFALPLLAAGQAQKEVFHNEAVIALELLAQPIVETIGDDTPPVAPAEGTSWIVGAAPTGAWSGHADTQASWTAGGWRFFAATDGMSAYVRASGLIARRRDGAWVVGRPAVAGIVVAGAQVLGARQPAIGAPAGGTIIDGEARAAIAAVLAALRTHGLIAT